MEKYQTAGRLVIRRPCPLVSEENFPSITLGSLCTLCTRSAKRTTFQLFHFLEALEVLNKGRIFPKENWYISKRNIELFKDRVRPCHWKVSKCQALGWLRTLYTGLAKTSSSKLLAAWKRFRVVNKGRTFSYRHFLDFEEKYGNISDCRTFSCFKTMSGCRSFSHFIAGTSATLTVCVTIRICCFAWTTTSTTLSSASSSPRAGNFNWTLVLWS